MSEKSVNLIKLAGLIAGDGCIDQRGRIIFKHSTIQKEYADYKAEKLFEYFGLKYNKYLCKKQENSFSTNDNYVIQTHPTSVIKNLRTLWYSNSKKNIPNELYENFTAEEWSFLYQDDGRLNKISHYNVMQNGIRVRKDCKPFVNRYEISLGFPTDELLQALQNSLLKYGIESSILVRKDKQRNLSISKSESKIKFYNLIKDYIHPSMNYKINILPTLKYLA